MISRFYPKRLPSFSLRFSGRGQREIVRPIRRVRALTLVEVMLASAVLGMLGLGMLATLIQSRNLTEGSIYQNTANSIMQGYVEQIKSMEFTDLPYTNSSFQLVPGPIPGGGNILRTRGIARTLNASGVMENVEDDLRVSTSAVIPNAQALLQATTPTNVIDNIKTFDINGTPNNTSDDLRLRIWIWIRDASQPTEGATQVRAIIVLYSWRPNNNTSFARSFVGSVRTIRSSVPTF